MNVSRIGLGLCCFLLSFKVFADPWQIEITPYLWAIGMNGRTQIGNNTAHIDQTFSDILKELDFGGMLWMSAKKNKFGLYGNAVYAVLSDSKHDGPFSADVHNRYGIFGAGISYEVFRYCTAQGCPRAQSIFYVEPYAGFRYTLNDTSITVAYLSASAHGVKNVHWTDPIIGLRLNYLLNKAWLAQLSGDIGGTNGSTHYSYSWAAILGLSPKSLPHSSFYVGYRLLDQRYQTGSGTSLYNWNMKLAGPVLGYGYTF